MRSETEKTEQINKSVLWYFKKIIKIQKQLIDVNMVQGESTITENKKYPKRNKYLHKGNL